MRKILYSLAGLGALALLASCNKEADSAVREDGAKVKATFTVQLPEGIDTKAISDGSGAAELLFMAYDKSGNHLDLDQTVPVSGYTATVSANLVKGVQYQFVFWAQSAGKYTSLFDSDAKGITLTDEYIKGMMNDDTYDAFYAYENLDGEAVSGAFSKAITLHRPFAQINVGAPVTLNTSNERTGGDFFAASKSGLAIDNTLTTAYTVTVPNKLNLLTGAVDGDTEVEMSHVSHPNEFLTVDGVKYDYAAMVYVLAGKESTTQNLALELKTRQNGTGVTLNRSVANVPLRRNYRTNILGNVFTVTGNFNIVVDQNFQKVDEYNDDYFPQYASIDALNEAFAAGKGIGYTVEVAPAAAVSGAQTIILPNTQDEVSIFFRGDFSAADITIVYSDAADAKKPGKLTLEAPLVGSATKSINKLVGNLPATTVVLAGTTTVDTADFHTASSTLVITAKAKVLNTLTVYAGSLVVEGFIETAVIDPAVAVNTVDAVATVEEDGEVVRFIVQNLNATIKEGAKVGTLEVSTSDGYTGDAPKVIIEGGATVETVEQKGEAKVEIKEDANVGNVEAENPVKIEGDGAEDVEFLIKNESQLRAAIEAEKTSLKIGADFSIGTVVPVSYSMTIDLNGHVLTNNVEKDRLFKYMNDDVKLAVVSTAETKGKLLIDTAQNPKSFGFVQFNSTHNTYLDMRNIEMEGVCTNGAFIRYRSYYEYVTLDDVIVTITQGTGMDYGNGINGYTAIVDASNNGFAGYDSLVIKNSKLIDHSGIEGAPYTAMNVALVECEFENTTFETIMSGAYYVGNSLFKNCTVTTKTTNPTTLSESYPWLAAAVATSNGRSVDIESGKYNGYYGLYVFSSGGSFNISGGEFSGSKNLLIMETDKSTYPDATSTATISGGKFKGDFKIKSGDLLRISGGEFSSETGKMFSQAAPGTISITGGTFSEDPSAYVALGYEAVDNGDGTWKVSRTSKVDYATFNAMLHAAGGEWTEPLEVVLKESQRDIYNNSVSQFYLNRILSVNVDGTDGDITVKNVTFTYEADDDASALIVGELQIPLSGSLTMEGCSFIGVSVSPWSTLEGSQTNYPKAAVFKNCTFKDLSGRYGIHQNMAKSLTVEGCAFANCERGIHTNCPKIEAITIKNNTFKGIGNEYGMLCLAEHSHGGLNGNVANASISVVNNDVTGQACLRFQAQPGGQATYEQVKAIFDNNTYGIKYATKSVKMYNDSGELVDYSAQ